MTKGKLISNSATELFSHKRGKIASKPEVNTLIILVFATILIAGCTAHRGMSHGSGSRSMSHANTLELATQKY